MHWNNINVTDLSDHKRSCCLKPFWNCFLWLQVPAALQNLPLPAEWCGGGGWESFTIRHSAIFTVFNKTGNFKRMLGSHLMAPEGLSLETFGTRAKGKFVLLLLDCALPQVNQCCFFCCSQDLLFLQTQNICFPWGEKNNKKKQLKKSPVCTEMAEITCNCHNLRGKKISSYLTCRVNLKKWEQDEKWLAERKFWRHY